MIVLYSYLGIAFLLCAIIPFIVGWLMYDSQDPIDVFLLGIMWWLCAPWVWPALVVGGIGWLTIAYLRREPRPEPTTYIIPKDQYKSITLRKKD